jgi:hypothetical protein
MIGDSLNCRGVCKKDMRAFLQDLIKNQMLDFVALQETVKKNLFSFLLQENQSL